MVNRIGKKGKDLRNTKESNCRGFRLKDAEMRDKSESDSQVCALGDCEWQCSGLQKTIEGMEEILDGDKRGNKHRERKVTFCASYV